MQSTSATRDGFQLMRDRFEVPKDTSALDPQTKRDLAICHLFLNRRLSVADIVWLLDEDSRNVVFALLENGIIRDRRNKPRKEHRQSIVSLRTERR